MIGYLIPLLDSLGYRPSTSQGGQTVGTNGMLHCLGSPATAPANTSVNTLWTAAIPALGVLDRIDVCLSYTCTSSANNKTIKATWGGVDLLIDTRTLDNYGCLKFSVQCQNSATAKAIECDFINGSVVSINTSGATSLIITGTKSAGAESLVLQSASIIYQQGVA